MKIKKNKMQNNKYTRVIRENSITKPVSKVSRKRIMMLTRRLNNLMLEKISLEEKNKDILDSLKSEKLISASLRKDSFYWQRLYHEAELTINSYKVKQNELVQTITTCLRENDSLYPHMVELTQTVTNNKIRLSAALKSIRNSDQGLPRQFLDKGNENMPTRVNAKNHHRVGPMVKGLLITKPKVMLERVMLPPTQEQESPPNNTVMVEGNNNLTPIPEEREHEENLEMRTVTIRPRQKLRKGWHVRRQGKLGRSRERVTERNNTSPTGVPYNGESSDTEGNVQTLDHMEPVVRIRDVSRLLQNSSLLKASRRSVPVDSQQDMASPQNDPFRGFPAPDKFQSESCEKRLQSLIQLAQTESSSKIDIPPKKGEDDGGGYKNGKRTSTTEDPKEGCSWMFQNNVNNHKKFPSTSPKFIRHSSIYKSDSSSEDEDTVIEPKNISNLSTLNTLVMRNNSMNSSPSERVSLKNQQKENVNTSVESISAEPDSTNNVDDFRFSNSSDNSSGRSSSYSISGNRLQTHSSNDSINTLNNAVGTIEVRKSEVNSPTVRLSNILHDSILLNSNKKSSLCGNCSPMYSSPDLGKRIRKPKLKIYPGEDDTISTSKPARFSVGKKTAYQKRNKARKSIEKKISSTSEIVTGGQSSESANSNKKSRKKVEPTEYSTEKKNKTKRVSSASESLSRAESSESSSKKVRKVAPSAESSLAKNKNKRVSSASESLSRAESSESSSKKVKKVAPSSESSLAKNKTKSSLKRSLYTPRSSSITGNASSRPSSLTSQDPEGTRSRRNKANINYKESPLNVKQRRP